MSGKQSGKSGRRQTTETCFVVMPYGKEFDLTYQQVYKPAITGSRLRPVRGDDFYSAASVMQEVWEGIQAATVVLADLTKRNPNVFYELGLAHVLFKPTVLVASTVNDVPFDLRSMRVLFYDRAKPYWQDLLREGLQAALSTSMDLPLDKLVPPYFNVNRDHEFNIGRAEWSDLGAIRAEIDKLRTEVAAPNKSPRKIYSRRAAEYAWFHGHHDGKSIAALEGELISFGVPRAWIRARKLCYRIPGFEEEG